MPQEVRRLNFDLPKSQFGRMTQLISELKMTQTQFLRDAVKRTIDEIQKEKLAQELAAGYKANAELDVQTCEDFKYIDRKNF